MRLLSFILVTLLALTVALMADTTSPLPGNISSDEIDDTPSTDSALSAEPSIAAILSGEGYMPPLTLEQLTTLPSPEAWAASRHTDETVDLATGTGRLDIPLFSWSAGEIHMSLSLSCRLGAFRTNEASGWIGLGWSLNGGGCVTRTIMGLPDEKGPLDIKADSWIGSNGDRAVQYLTDTEDMRVDAMADRYSYSCPEASGEFLVIGGEIVQTPKSDNAVEFTGAETDGVRDFLVTTPDGTRYWFTEREHASYRFAPSSFGTQYACPDYTEAVTAWHLSRIESPGGETVTFSYKKTPSWTRATVSPSVSYTVSWVEQASGHKAVLETPDHEALPSRSVTYFDDQKVLSEIRSSTATVSFTTVPRPGAAEDTPVLLTSIDVRSADGKSVRNIRLTHTGNGSCLLSSVETKADGTLLGSHSFSYNETGGSCTDFFGFRSQPGEQWNTVIDPNTGRLNDRIAYSLRHCIGGTLSTHADANGLVTQYSYEAALVTCTVRGEDTTFAIGARLRSVTATDGSTGRTRVRTFSYSGGVPSLDMSRLDAGAFVSVSGTSRAATPPAGVTYHRTVSFHSSSRTPGSAPENARPLYSRVEETVSGTSMEHGARTVYEFDVTRCAPPFTGLGGAAPNFAGGYTGRWTAIPDVALPAEFPAGVTAAIATGSPMRGFFAETAGIEPLLTRVTRMEHDGNAYRILSTEEHSWLTADSARNVTGVAHESAVCTRTDALGVTSRDYTSPADFRYANTSIVCARHLPDSTATVTHHPDGSTRLATVRHVYSSPKPPLVSRPGQGGVISLLVPDPAPFNCDTITRRTRRHLHTGTRRREGGHTIEHYTAVAANITGSAFYDAVQSAGQLTLPVREMWVVDGRDTVTRSVEYARFGTAYRPTWERLDVNGSELDSRRVHGYTARGLPTAASSPGKPTVEYTWDSYGQPLSVKTSGGSLSQTVSYTHAPLVGCTSVTSPDGSTVSYTYDGARLTAATNAEGATVSRWEYSLPGPYGDGAVRVRELSRLNDAGGAAGSFSAVTAHYDGFGLTVLELAEGYGSGGDVGTLTRHDAMHRPVAKWRPLPVTDAADVLASDEGLETAAISLYKDKTAHTALAYPASGDDMPSSSALPGSDFADHPTLAKRGCCSSKEGPYRVIRYSVVDGSLRSSGHYGDGELDCVTVTEPDGSRTMTFTDALGRTVLVRRDAGAGKFADTHTVRDTWGNPLVVLPPEASSRLSSASGNWALSDNTIAKYAFMYTYDSRLRLRSSKVPGCGAVERAYDRDGRLAFTRDARQREEGTVTFRLYDALERPAVIGVCSDLADDIWSVDASQSTLPMTAALSGEARTGFAGSGYTPGNGWAGRLPGASLLTATYYDAYTFLPSGWASIEASAPDGSLAAPVGQVTGSLSAVLGDTGSRPLLTVYTRRKGGVVVREECELPGGARNAVTTAPSVAGLPMSVSDRLKTASSDMTATTANSYDTFGRLLSSHCYVPKGASFGTTHRLVGNAYNAVGELEEENFGAIRRNVSRDIRGALSGWSAAGMTQTLGYGAAGKTADWTGRLTREATTRGSVTRSRDFSYSKLGNIPSYDIILKILRNLPIMNFTLLSE